MSLRNNPKFLKLFNINEPKIKNGKKLGKKLLFINFINCNIYFIQLILDYTFIKSECIICAVFNFCLFTPFDFTSLFFLIKSFINKRNKYKYLNITNIFIIYAF